MREKIAAIAAVTMIACSSSSGGAASAQANMCATRGATYLVSFTEISGTCGPIPSSIINIGSDGTLVVPSAVSCDRLETSGCTTHETNCRSTNNGVNATITSSVTFVSDGSAAMGLETISLTNGSQSCTSTYNVTATRQ